MNDKRKLHREYISNKGPSKEQVWADDLLFQLQGLLKLPGLTTELVNTICKMIDQIEQSKNTLPKAILRSMAAKIERIRCAHER